jgi:hypothetical protein
MTTMSDLIGEEVFRMPPVSTAAIEIFAEEALKELQPECLQSPHSVDVRRLVDTVLPELGIFVSPASYDEMGQQYGATDPTGHEQGGIEILLREDVWDNLAIGGALARLPRATVAHEIGHALIHVPVVRRRLRSPHAKHLLAREDRSQMKPFEDPEWQAWTFAGCLLMPRRTLTAMARITPWDVASIYQVSESFAQSHLRRLRIRTNGGQAM